ncbi:MAG TPA: endonuclease/exonuclease/phosphatase family protein [Mycobacteriales bacterium]|nr:endonuclease/exonuclease/phosphatase family protein [Mycobacteriales bacterium]
MSEPTPAAELRVMTYNVRSLRDDVTALASIVRAADPDVVLVQEAPRFLRWRSKRAALARRCGLVVATADRPGGLCILVALRVDVLGTTFTMLPRLPGHHQRVAVGAILRRAGQRWRVLDLHLSTDPAERERHVPLLVELVGEDTDPPLVVGGDINDVAGSPAYSVFSERMQDCFAVAGAGSGATAPARTPQRRIDAVFAGPAVDVVACEVLAPPSATRASDHLPVLAVLRQHSG